MKRIEIQKLFTEKVNEYISKGYIFSYTTGGSQGELMKADLVKDNELVRVWIEREGAFRRPEFKRDYFAGNLEIVRVGKCHHQSRDFFDIVWMRDLEVIEEHIFYEVRQYEWYVDSLEEMQEILKKKTDRRHNPVYKPSAFVTHYDSEKAKEIGANLMKRKAGYQRLRRSDIEVMRYQGEYLVSYRDYSYRLR